MGVEDEVVSEHLGVILAFVSFGPAGGCAGYDVGEVASGAGRDDGGDVPVEAGVGADKSVGEDPMAIVGGGAAAEAGFDLRGLVGKAKARSNNGAQEVGVIIGLGGKRARLAD